MTKILTYPAGLTLRTHDAGACGDEACCVHRPSDHHMAGWTQLWRSDRGLMERLCPEHGTGHPDPDDLAFKRRTRGEESAWAESIHGCCGCCRPGGES
jgi:hypothetical protein